MGGDHAPDAILAGALDAVELLGPGDRLVLVGDRESTARRLDERGCAEDPRIELEPTSDTIAMDEAPVTAIRNKPESSIVRLARLGSPKAGERRCDIVVSAGNTGAVVAAAQMTMRRLHGVHRPGIAVTMPGFHGPTVLCDAGANPEPRPAHLFQYAHMASVYAREVVGIDIPRVGLLSIGGEEGKGNSLVRETGKLLRADETLNYVGYVEGRDFFNGAADVVITEGFTGNVMLKLAEGLIGGLFATISREIAAHDRQLAKQFEPIAESIYRKHDYHEYGGAPLLGANGICVICHGSSAARTITSAIRNAIPYAQHGVNEAIVDALANTPPAGEGPA